MSFLAACESRKYPSTGRKASKGGKRKKRLSERRGNLFTMLSVSFFNVVKQVQRHGRQTYLYHKKMKGNEDYHPA